MTTTTAIHEAIRLALVADGVHAVYGPADDLPVSDGLVGQAAVLWPSAGAHQYTRTTGTRSGRSDRLTIVCVGATARDAIAVADAVERAIGGLMLSVKGSPLRHVLTTSPQPEPDADPRRVSLSVEYSTITKG